MTGATTSGRIRRRNIVPEERFRGRVLGRHRSQSVGWVERLRANLGWISDRNFLEQYYEREWDEFQDQTTGAETQIHVGQPV